MSDKTVTARWFGGELVFSQPFYFGGQVDIEMVTDGLPCGSWKVIGAVTTEERSGHYVVTVSLCRGKVNVETKALVKKET